MPLWIAIIAALSLLLSHRAEATDLFAKKGRLVLPPSGLGDDVFNLKGDWLFYTGALTPRAEGCPDGTNLDIMRYWNANELDQHPEWAGTNSFCLHIENPARQNLSLWWPERSSVDIYANGQLVFGRGRLPDEAGHELTRRQTGVVFLTNEAQITVWVHGNNEFMRWRKIRENIFFGSSESVERNKERHQIFDIFIISSILGTGFYQFALFWIHRGRRETLYLGLFCVALALRYGGIGHSNVFTIFAPGAMGGRGFGLGHVGYFLGAACFYQFLGVTYPDLLPRGLIKTLWLVAVLFSVLCLLVGSPVYARTLLFFHPVSGICMVSALIAMLRAIRQKREGSIVLGLGTLFLSVTAWADMIRSQGVGLPFDIFPLGQLVFATTASLLVSIRFSHALHTLSHLSHELSKIVPLHVIPLLRNGIELEQCMPTGEHEAVALVFDVVGSSRVTHPGFRKSLDICMSRFFDAINEGYEPERLEATGYRIKEMGDGMICTVGFPFRVPGAAVPDVVALQLAERMCAIFHEEMARMGTPEPITCSIGLARGRVEGFFPQAGQKQYDLRGAPLTLATRYEAMRNPVYRRFGRKGSVIFIHDAVYQRLLPRQQASFERWDTSLPGQAIRDDEQATQAWFKFVETADSISVCAAS